ncbi:MAG: Wzz/FepE/Etk N-terminal domain-containing protein [bacterium]|nr:Wzz/FepE/Etk N-terminal domain-containing protein [bacterium]
MDEQEVDLIDYVNVIVKRKWVIVVGTLVCSVLAVVYNGTREKTPPVYEARATLLILPPPFKDELKLPSFSTDVYQTLAKAQDLEQTIIDSLRLKDAKGERLRISALDGVLQTEPGAQQGAGSSLDLIVTSSDTARMSPAKIVNVWASLFVRENNGLTTQEAIGNYEFISEQYEIARRNLNAAEDSLNAFEGGRDLALLRAELEAKNAKLLEYQKEYVNSSLALRRQIQNLDDFQAQLAAMETPAGVWVGEWHIEGTGGIDLRRLSDDRRRVLDMIVQTRDRLRSLQEWVQDFRDENDLEFQTGLLNEKKATLNTYLKELLNIHLDAVSTDQALKEIRALNGNQNRSHGGCQPGVGGSLPGNGVSGTGLQSVSPAKKFSGTRIVAVESRNRQSGSHPSGKTGGTEPEDRRTGFSRRTLSNVERGVSETEERDQHVEALNWFPAACESSRRRTETAS